MPYSTVWRDESTLLANQLTRLAGIAQRLPDVVAIIEPELFEAVQRQLEENRRRSRSAPGSGSCYLLSGLAACSCCGYAYAGKKIWPSR